MFFLGINFFLHQHHWLHLISSLCEHALVSHTHRTHHIYTLYLTRRVTSRRVVVFSTRRGIRPWQVDKTRWRKKATPRTVAWLSFPRRDSPILPASSPQWIFPPRHFFSWIDTAVVAAAKPVHFRTHSSADRGYARVDAEQRDIFEAAWEKILSAIHGTNTIAAACMRLV